MKVDIFDTQGRKVGDIDLEDSVFGAPVKPWLFWEIVRAQLAARRRGTHKTKTVSEVRGSNKKPYRQKGTGQARHGQKRALGMRGGATVHGPKPRDYSYKVPRKMVQGALRSALSARAGEKKLIVIRDWKPSSPKTKAAKAILGVFGAQKALVVDRAENETLSKSLRNLPHVKFLPAEAINVYDILKYDHLFVGESVVQGLNARLKTSSSRRELERAERLAAEG